MTIPGHLFDHATRHPDEVAYRVLAAGDVTTLTWDQLARAACEYADWFRDSGVQPGDVVVLCLKHSPTLYPAHLGAMLAGAIPSFVSFPTPKQDPVLYWEAHAVLFDRVRPAAVLTYADNAVELQEILPPGARVLVDRPFSVPTGDEPIADLADRHHLGETDAVALLQHSSGTTGHKKGVMLTHRHIELYVDGYMTELGLTRADTVATWLPLYHDMGLITAYLAPLLAGATVVSMDAFEWVDRPHMLLEIIDEYQCRTAWLPNFAFNHLVRTKQGGETYRLDHVHSLVCAAEPVKIDLIDRFVETFAEHGIRADQMATGYGGAEVVCAVTIAPPGTPIKRAYFDATALRVGRAVSREPGPGAVGYLSNGPVMAGVEIRVDPRADVPGEGIAIGELQFRGELLFEGYYQNPKATAAAFDGEWYRTGDLGCLVDDEVFVVGRTKDVIIHHGVNYYAHDIEAVASGVPGVKPGRCAALAVYDDQTGSERVELVVERDLDHPVEDQELRRALRNAIADRYQVAVARVHLVELGWLVKTTSGKISRSDNLTKLHEHPPTDGLDDAEWAEDDEVPDDLEHLVRRTIATTFNVPIAEVQRSTTATEVEGWDSLGHTVLLIRLSNFLGVEISEDVAALATDVGELIDLLEPLAGGS